MALKTFNVNPAIYKKFSEFCKGNGMSMSKQVEMFMASQVEEEPEFRAEYIKKLDKLSKGRFVKVDDVSKRYGW